jgi:hypothetical protein
LNYRFYGPYQIIKVVSHVVYRLDLPSGSKIHPAFSCFSTEESRHTLVANSKPLPNMLSEDLKLQVEPKEVKAVCINSVGNVEVLIQWKDLRYFEATWVANSYNYFTLRAR